MEIDKMALLQKHFSNFDKHMKLVDFLCETETFYDLAQSDTNITKMNQRLADASALVIKHTINIS